MKILYQISGIGPPSGWGTEFIQDIIFEIAKDKNQVTIINPIYKHTDPSWPEWTRQQEKKYNLHIISIEAPEVIKKNLYIHFALTPIIITWQTIKMLKQERFDIVHEFSSTPLILIRSLLLKLLFNIPTVFTLSVYNNTFLGRFFWFKVFDFAKVYCVPSEEIIKSLEDSGISKKKIRLIRPTVNIDKFSTKISSHNARVKLNLPDNKIIVTYFGSLTREKGVSDLINAIQLLPKNIKQRILVVIWAIWKGSNQHINFIRQIEKLDLPYLKFQEKYVDIPTALAASDLLIFPQQSGHGTTIPQISILEAIAAKKRIISVNILGNRDIFKNADNELSEPNNSHSLCQKIVEGINELGNQQELKVNLSEYKLENVVKSYLQVYKEVMMA